MGKKKKKKATPPPKESSGSESSDEEEKTAKPEKDDSDSSDDEPKKEAKAKDESDSEDSSEDEPSKKDKPKPKDDSDSGSSEDEDKEPRKKMDVEKSEPVEKPKKAGSDSDPNSSSDSDAPSNKEEKPASKKEESNDSSDSGSEDEKPKPKKEKAKAKADSDDSSSDESSSEEDKPAEKKEDDSDSSSDSEKGKSPPATPNKRKSSFGDGSPAKRGRPAGGTKTELKGTTQRVFVGNLSYDIDDEKCKEFFKEVGELTDIFWLTDRESGDFKGCGFLSFATAEMADKAVEQMAGKELMGRPLKIDWAEERKGGKKKGGRVPDWVNNPLSERPDNCYSVFLGNLDFNITEDDVKKHFKECGELKSIRWMQKDGEFKGAGFVEFETTEAVDKAVKLCGKEIIGRAARVDYAKPRAPRN